jgi:hypothetical protein
VKPRWHYSDKARITMAKKDGIESCFVVVLQENKIISKSVIQRPRVKKIKWGI